MVHRALEAAETLAADGIEVEVVDPRTLSPLDEPTILESVRKTGRLVVADEDNPRCSVAHDIVAIVANRAFGDLRSAPQIVTPPHAPVPFSPVLEDSFIPSAADISAAIYRVLGRLGSSPTT
jgi:pyruvate dehydrogenase E1 component beta subunit